MITPYLREDLELIKGNSREDGSPGWLLYDALRNKYFTIGIAAFRLISNWKPGEDISKFNEWINKKGLKINLEEIKSFISFLANNNLIIQPKGQNITNLLFQKNSQKKNWLMYLIHSYLFFKVPLFKPDEWLGKTLKYTIPYASKQYRYIIYLIGFIGICLVVQQFEDFLTTFMYFFSIKGLLFYAITLIAVKILHELGHAYVAKYYGCQVSSIGIAFLVFFPFLYTDTTNAWRLRNHNERLLINFAGILTELHLALIATFVWAIVPDGAIKSIAFFVATTSWISSLTINVSPFMRFDGYYIFSDWLKAENLQPRAFALARWKIRELLFGFYKEPPEELSKNRKWIFISYAWFTWIYRFFLFLGIAFLVYYFAFKVLGIILFIIEIYWFIAKPIINEVSKWWKMRTEMKINYQTKRTLLFSFLILFLVFFPWKSSLKIPAVFTSEEYVKIYSSYPAIIKEINVIKDQVVEKGDVLINLEIPQLSEEIQSTRIKISLAKTQINRLSKKAGNLDQYMVFQQTLIALLSELKGLNKIKTSLTIKAPIKGRIKNFYDLSIGHWISSTDELMGIVNYGSGQVIGFISENSIDRFKLNKDATFIPFDGLHDIVQLTSISIDKSATQNLSYLTLSSNYGGPIAVRSYVSGNFKNRPEEAFYRANFKPLNKENLIKWEIPGYVHIDGYRYSPFLQFIKNLLALLIREIDF